MGSSSSTGRSSVSGAAGGNNAPSSAPRGFTQSLTFRFRAIADQYNSLEQVQQALRQAGLESSNLIVAVDYTKSNEWTGKVSFGGRCLHSLNPSRMNPYEQAIQAIGKTLAPFDDDGEIPVYGFGDTTTGDRAVFSFLPSNAPLLGLDAVLARYKELTPNVRLSGPTSFAPAIYQAMKICVEKGNQYHILLLVADGQVTRSSDIPYGSWSEQEQQTINAITAASKLPLSIIMVGVGDGPWDMMKQFDDALPQRAFDNFQFVNFTEIMAQHGADTTRRETLFALRALMEIPEQYKTIQRLGLIGRRTTDMGNLRHYTALDPPGPRPGYGSPPPPSFGAIPGAPAYPSAPSAPYSGGPAPYGTAPAMPYGAPPAMPYGAPPSAPYGGYADANGAGSSGPVNRSSRTATDPLFICPITQEVMRDPVLAADGYSYERAAIAEWLSRKDTSPMTNTKLEHKNLIPNHGLRSAILEAQQEQKKLGSGGGGKTV